MPRATRPPATIVVVAWNVVDATRGCLETLRPAIGVRDRVVVVDNGSADATAALLKRAPWVTTVTNEDNRGCPAARNQGAAIGDEEIVVFLDNDTVVPGGFLDRLLAPFADETVGAVGPMSNRIDGGQQVATVPYAQGDRRGLRDFVTDFQRRHAREVLPIDRLSGVCLAVRRSAFEAVGGFDERFGLGGGEAGHLCRRLVEAGWALRVAGDAYLHHDGGLSVVRNGVDPRSLPATLPGESPEANVASGGGKGLDLSGVSLTLGRPARQDDTPFLTAALIVKDEEDMLGDCLASIAPHVDRVVVYDTGSSDRTVEIAREAGATVVEGYWDDDFARARNAALAACSGEWVLSIDADERLRDSGTRLAELVRQRDDVDLLRVVIANLRDDGSAIMTHHAPRLFRRAVGMWQGALHEEIVALGRTPLRVADLDGPTIAHLGYAESELRRKDKGARNIRVAEAAVARSGRDPRELLNLGRSLMVEHRYTHALLPLADAAAAGEVSVRRAALRAGAQSLIQLNRAEEALDWLSRLREISLSTTVIELLEACAHVQLGRLDEAVILEDVAAESAHDDEGLGLPLNFVRTYRGALFLARARIAEAADLLLPNLLDLPVAVQGNLLAGMAQEGLLPRLADEFDWGADRQRVVGVVGLLVRLDPGAVDALCERIYQLRPQDAHTVAIVWAIAPTLTLERAVEWTTRWRVRKLTERCPVYGLARAVRAEPATRAVAAAILVDLFGEPRGTAALREAVALLTPDQFDEVLASVGELAPAALPELVMTAASDPYRCFALAQSLKRLGAGEQATELVHHGLSQQPGDALRAEGERLLAAFAA